MARMPKGLGIRKPQSSNPHLRPICARTGGPGLEWETIDRCINYRNRGQNSLCTWENLLTLPCHQYVCPGQLTVLTWLLFIHVHVHVGIL